MNKTFFPRQKIAFAIAAILLGSHALANQLSDLDALRIQRIKMINTMLTHRAISSDKADEMIKDINRKTSEAKDLILGGGAVDMAAFSAASVPVAAAAAAPASATAVPVAAAVVAAPVAAVVTDDMKNEMREQIKRELAAEMRAQMSDDIKRQVLAELTGASGSAGVVAQATDVPAIDPVTGKPKPRVVRVPYVPESMRREIREQVKTEVLAQAKEERWGNPNTLPEWLDRFQFEGDMRLRYDSFMLSQGNTPAGVAGNVSATGLTRGADLVGSNGNLGGAPNFNTQQDFNRTRLRARFGANIKVSDMVSAGFRVATGSTSGPTSTNQTLGQGFNRYTLTLDRGFVTLKPTPWLSLTGGRIANPFMSTDLVWADDLNFEGVAATYSPYITPELGAFVTAGWFPLRTDNPGQTSGRDLVGLQGGLKWRATPTTDVKLAASLYDYHGMAGKLEDNTRFGPPSASDYGTKSEYPQGLRQRGNTLFITNALADPLTGNTYWGLASEFREFDLTGSIDLAQFDPTRIVLTGDFVKNLAFSRNKMFQRTGANVIDGKDYGYLAKILVGQPTMARSGDWNVSLAYRWLGSDAVLDAFTNSDFGLGGTNNKGFIFGGSYGIDKNTWVSARWMGSDLINSMAPAVGPATVPSKLSVDLLQVDLNAKF